MSCTCKPGQRRQRPAAALVEGTEGGKKTYVAQIGDAKYETLQEAVDAAADGDTVALLADAELTETLNITKAITLDGAEHKITGKSSDGKTSFITVKTDGGFTMKNATILPTKKVEANAAIDLQVKGKVIIDSCVFGAAEDQKQFMYNGLEFSQKEAYPMADGTTISNCTFYGGSFRHNFISFYRIAEGATIQINGNKFLNANWDTTNAIRVSNYGNASATINLFNDTYSDDGSERYKDYAGLLFFQRPKNCNDDFTKLTVNIEELDTTGAQSDQLFYVYNDVAGQIISTNQPVVKGDSSIENFFVAKVDDAYYKTLSAAIAAAKDGDTVKLLKECDEDVTIRKKIALTAADHVVFKGTLTFDKGSAGSKVFEMTFNYAGSKANIITINSAASGVTVGGCDFTLNELSESVQPNCIFILDAKGTSIVENQFHLAGTEERSAVAINLSGEHTDKTTVSKNEFDVLTGGDTTDSLFFFKAMGEVTPVGESFTDHIENLRMTDNQIDGSHAENGTYFAGLSGVMDPVITGNKVENCFVGIFNVKWTYGDVKYGANNSLNNEIISGNTYTDMTRETYITLAKAARKYGDTWTDYNSVQDAVDAIQPGDKVTGRSVSSENSATVTLDYNDGTDTATTITVPKNTEINLPTPTRSGHTFRYWADSNGSINEGTTTVTGDLTFTAVWTSNGSSSRYNVTVEKADHGAVSANSSRASKGDTVTVTVKPDSGYVLETITVTDKDGKELELTDKGGGKYTFTMPRSAVTVKATFEEDNSVLNFFYDVPNDAYYYEAVAWAVENGVTAGVGDNLFGSGDPCSRAQIVTFLFKAYQGK